MTEISDEDFIRRFVDEGKRSSEDHFAEWFAEVWEGFCIPRLESRLCEFKGEVEYLTTQRSRDVQELRDRILAMERAHTVRLVADKNINTKMEDQPSSEDRWSALVARPEAKQGAAFGRIAFDINANFEQLRTKTKETKQSVARSITQGRVADDEGGYGKTVTAIEVVSKDFRRSEERTSNSGLVQNITDVVAAPLGELETLRRLKALSESLVESQEQNGRLPSTKSTFDLLYDLKASVDSFSGNIKSRVDNVERHLWDLSSDVQELANKTVMESWIKMQQHTQIEAQINELQSNMAENVDKLCVQFEKRLGALFAVKG